MPNLTSLALSISGGIQVAVKGNAPGNGANISGVLNPLSAAQQVGSTLQLAFGTGTSNATQVYLEARMLAPSANETINLANGLPDMFGNSSANVGFTTIRGVYYQITDNANGANTARSMTVGNAALPFSNFLGANTATVVVSSTGPPYQNGNSTGLTVSVGTNHQTKVINNDAGNSLTYVIAIAGQ